MKQQQRPSGGSADAPAPGAQPWPSGTSGPRGALRASLVRRWPSEAGPHGVHWGAAAVRLQRPLRKWRRVSLRVGRTVSTGFPCNPATEGALRDAQVCTDLRGLLRVCWRVSGLPAEGPDGKHFSRRGPYTGSSHMPLCPFCFCFHSPLKTQITLAAPRSRRRGWVGLRGPRFAGTHMRPRLCSEPSRPRCAEVHNQTLRRKSRRCHRTEPTQPGQLRAPIFGNRLQLMVARFGSLGQVSRVGLSLMGLTGMPLCPSYQRWQCSHHHDPAKERALR